MTMNDVVNLKEAISTRRRKIDALKSMIKDSQRRYRTMTIPQLNEAVRDVVGMREEIAKHERFIKNEEERVKEFFACAIR